MCQDNDSATDIVELGRIKPRESLPGGIKGCLKFLQGPEKGKLVYLETPYNTLGRNSSNTVILSGTDVSGRHLAIYFSESLEWRIEDLGSTNGTLLNGSKVTEYALRSGDKIFLGGHLLQFSIERG